MKQSKFLILLLAVGMIFLISCKKPDSGDYMNENQDVRIQNVFKKIRNGQPVSVVAIGGSITTGYNANPINENSWAALTEKWFKDLAAKNNCELSFANMGIGGTDSAFGAVRIKDHVINKKADLVILEFAMNDQWLEGETRQRTYEGCIRQIMNNSEAAVLALFVNQRNYPYSSNQEEQQKICEYYHIPFVSWKDCLFAENPDATFDPYFEGTETIHPANAGHAKIASYITQKLQNVWDNLPKDKEIAKPVKALPAPFTDDAFEHIEYLTSENTTPVENSGWEAGSPAPDEWTRNGDAKHGWQTYDPSAEMVFEVEGSTIGITYCESDQFQNAVVWITDENDEDLALVVLNCYVSYRNGYYGWAYRELIHGDEVKKYKVHVSLYDIFSESEDQKYGNITGIVCAK